MTVPLVAIVGRTNVGKSTLVNRIAATTKAIVDRESGVTRDRNYIQTDWNGKPFVIIDTGGLEFGRASQIEKEVVKQSLLAIEEADVLVLLVDAQSGILPLDTEVAQVLRESDKPKILVVNKCDNPAYELAQHEFHKLGLGETVPISAVHGLGIGELMDEIVSLLPAVSPSQEKVDVSIAIVGRPNVGKSSVLNQLLGEERAIVTSEPGTTRDAVDTIFNYNDSIYRLIDTAGLKKQSRKAGAGKAELPVDYYGFVRTIRAISEADVALLIIDSSEGATRQDVKIAGLCEEKGCATVVVLNKWDLVKGKDRENVIADIRERMKFLSYAPLTKTSAKKGQGLDQIPPLVEEISHEYKKRISTSKLNQLLMSIKASGHQPKAKGKKVSISYITQVKIQPPRFVIFANHPSLIEVSYKRYLENKLREEFGFLGCPLKIHFKKKNK